MLTFHTVTDNGTINRIYFDPYTFKFYKDSDKQVLLQAPHCTYFRDDDQLYHRTLILALGYKCNNKCIYCPQKHFVDPEYDRTRVMQIISKLKSEGLECIHFIGGEPMLDFGIIEDIVESYPDLKYSIVTNGLYLEPSNTEFFADHQFKVTLSHDGESQHLQRGIDILHPDSSQYSLIQWLSTKTEVAIASVLCNDGMTTKDRYRYFTRGGIDFKYIDVKPMIPFSSQAIKLVPGISDWNKYFLELLSDLADISIDIEHTDDYLNILTNVIYLCFNVNSTYHSGHTRCPIWNPDIITIDKRGNEIYCHNKAEHHHRKVDTLLKRLDRLDRCKDCPILLLCTGGCRLLADDTWEVTCKSNYYHYLAYLIHFVYRAFGYMVTSIEGDFFHATNGTFTIATLQDEKSPHSD